jgi:hypothetical protein
MPLQLGGVETLRAQSVIWDVCINEQCLEATTRIKELEKLGFTKCQDAYPGYVTLDPPKKDPHIGVFRIISQNGDDRVIWDRREPKEVKEAFQKFKDLVSKGYVAYAATSDGRKGHKITEFDPGLEEVIFVPKTKPG